MSARIVPVSGGLAAVVVAAACANGCAGACSGGGGRGPGNAAGTAGSASATANANASANAHANAATPAAPAPCPPAPSLDCTTGFEVAWDAPPRATGNAAALVTRAGISTLLHSPRHGTGVDAVDRGILATRTCAGGSDAARPGAGGAPTAGGSDAARPGAGAAPIAGDLDVPLLGAGEAYLVAATTSATLTVAIGVLPGAVTHRYEPSTLLLWIDRGAGFEAPSTLDDAVARSVAVEAVPGADGSIALVWSAGERGDDLAFARLDAAGTLSPPKALGRVPYGVTSFRLVALPAGGWAMVQAGRGARRLTASLLAADGTLGRPRTLVDAAAAPADKTRPLDADVPGGFALAWDGEAIALAYETGDYGRDASGASYGRGGSTAPAGSIGWSAQPDTHALHFLRVAPDLTPLGPPVTLERAADVDRPAALVHHAGHYLLLGATMSPTPRRAMSPQLVRFTAAGAITHRVPLPIPTLPWRATLAADGAAIRGTLTAGAALRPFTLRCAAP